MSLRSLGSSLSSFSHMQQDQYEGHIDYHYPRGERVRVYGRRRDSLHDDYAIRSLSSFDDCSHSSLGSKSSRCSRNSRSSRSSRRGYLSAYASSSARRLSIRSRTGEGYPPDYPRPEDRSNRRYVSLTPPRPPPAHREQRVHVPMIEIAPGVYERLRSANETMEAIRMDFFVPCECLSCQETIFCIQDSAYILCPRCRVVSKNGATAEEDHQGGVGIGFTFEHLANVQAQIQESDVN